MSDAAFQGFLSSIDRMKDRADFDVRIAQVRREARKLWERAEENGRIQRETAVRLCCARNELAAFQQALAEAAPEHPYNTREGRQMLRHWAARAGGDAVKNALGLPVERQVLGREQERPQ